MPSKYHEADLSRAEAVCIDRCVAKFQEIHEMAHKFITENKQQPGASPRYSLRPVGGWDTSHGCCADVQTC